ncbi:hypothetical protein Ade02nite_34740 [Paractinoplanes deccanensis]|uniref:Uncharacterized protein n=1 Tax=Paractinoplanes deccanensis TaxID=113561 RepID=A0ABQ3Y4B1_9ACTN|nr:hypothetical protein [Actinoplanes deccanensis]GID74833.1 hypothetical protein Ade02nite_34740 [Actinoplanes deccanensis]
MATHDPSTGQVWTFAEADYRYGSGPLRIRIDRVLASAPIQQDGEVWYEVEGLEFNDQGTVIGPRRATIRASRLPAVRRNSSR